MVVDCLQAHGVSLGRCLPMSSMVAGIETCCFAIFVTLKSVEKFPKLPSWTVLNMTGLALSEGSIIGEY